MSLTIPLTKNSARFLRRTLTVYSPTATSWSRCLRLLIAKSLQRRAASFLQRGTEPRLTNSTVSRAVRHTLRPYACPQSCLWQFGVRARLFRFQLQPFDHLVCRLFVVEQTFGLFGA